jgi:hypothetical protein
MTTGAFISYSNLDRSVAETLCAALEANGTRCWIAPRDIAPSREWAEEIIDGINGARVMLLVFSSNSNGSPQVRREIERAIHKELPVIPFRIENIVPTKSMEYFLSAQHWFDAYDEPVASYMPRLCSLIARLCSAPAGPVAAVAADAPSTAASVFTGNPYGQGNGGSGGMATTPEPQVQPAPIPVRTTFPEADLALLETQLAVHIGPIARLLVRKAAARSTDRQGLVEALADELDLPVERTAFLAACRQRLGR